MEKLEIVFVGGAVSFITALITSLVTIYLKSYLDRKQHRIASLEPIMTELREKQFEYYSRVHSHLLNINSMATEFKVSMEGDEGETREFFGPGRISLSLFLLTKEFEPFLPTRVLQRSNVVTKAILEMLNSQTVEDADSLINAGESLVDAIRQECGVDVFSEELTDRINQLTIDKQNASQTRDILWTLTQLAAQKGINLLP